MLQTQPQTQPLHPIRLYQSYPQIRAWLTRIEQLPGFVPMVSTAVGLAA